MDVTEPTFTLRCRCIPERGHDDECPNHPAFAPLDDQSHAAPIRGRCIVCGGDSAGGQRGCSCSDGPTWGSDAACTCESEKRSLEANVDRADIPISAYIAIRQACPVHADDARKSAERSAACICDPPGWLEARDERCPLHGVEALPAFWGVRVVPVPVRTLQPGDVTQDGRTVLRTTPLSGRIAVRFVGDETLWRMHRDSLVHIRIEAKRA